MKRGLQTVWRWLTDSAANLHEEEARREFMTRVVLSMVAGALLVFTLPILIGCLAGTFDWGSLGVMLLLDLSAAGSWWLVYRGRQRFWVGVILVGAFFLLGAFLNSLGGAITTAPIFYVIAILLAAALHGGAVPWIALALSIGAYVYFSLTRNANELDLVLTGSITIAGGLIGVTLLEWFAARLLTHALGQVRTHEQQLEHEIAEREQAQQALQASMAVAREFQQKLMALHEIGIELQKAPNTDDLLRRAIELGREWLGFDRLGVWLMRGEQMIGTFGTGPDGQLRDERHYVLKRDELPRIRDMVANNLRVAVWQDVPLMDITQVEGHGWNALALLWNGDEALGWLATDNMLSQQPMRPYELELLTLYGATLGHLYTIKQAEDTLRTSEARYRAVIDGVPVCLFALDREGIFTFLEGRNRIMGMEPHALLGRSIQEMHPHLSQVARIFQQTLAGEDQSVVMQGNGVWEEVRISPLRNAAGEIIGVIGVATDVTDRKHAEEQRLQLALEKGRVKILTDFIAYASHEFRTPLSVINTTLYLLERMDNPEMRRKRLQAAAAQAEYIQRLIDSMLKMVQLEQGVSFPIAPVRLDGLLHDLINRFSDSLAKKRLALTVDLPDDLPTIFGDAGELRVALGNLLDNAIDYTPAGGNVSIRALVRDTQAVVEISDSGIGISSDALPHIFDHFYRVDQARTARRAGLGLPIARKIVEAHQGRIEVESTLGQGSTFRVVLPLQ